MQRHLLGRHRLLQAEMRAPSFPQPDKDLVQPPLAWKARANQPQSYFRLQESSFA